MRQVTRKKIVDIVLLVLLLAEACGHLLPRSVHIGLGFVLLAGIIYHCFLNRTFFISLRKGTWNWRRRGNAAVILFFAVCLAVNAVSGICLMEHLSGPDWHGLHQWTAWAALVFLLLHLSFQLPRYLHGKKAIVAAVVLIACAVFAIAGPPYISHWFRPALINQKNAIPGEKVNLPGKTLTVYFSWRDNENLPENVQAVSGASLMRDGDEILGNTQVLAEMVQDATGSDLLSLKVKDLYPSDYRATTQRARQEQSENARPELASPIPDLTPYQNIVLIYPLWWGTLPMPVESFLESVDLSGKTVIPIVTQGGSSASDSVKDLTRLTKARVVQDPLSLDSSFVPRSRHVIVPYLRRVVAQ